jgi:hypothetical protein
VGSAGRCGDYSGSGNELIPRQGFRQREQDTLIFNTTSVFAIQIMVPYLPVSLIGNQTFTEHTLNKYVITLMHTHHVVASPSVSRLLFFFFISMVTGPRIRTYMRYRIARYNGTKFRGFRGMPALARRPT